MMRTLGVCFMCVWAAACVAQEQRPALAGTVMGVVMCSDTQRPARLAEVMLVEAPTAASLKAQGKSAKPGGAAQAGNPVDTSLDGSYAIHHVKPGRYYVVVDMPAYLLPLAQFSAEELAATDALTRQRVARGVHTITVTGNDTVREDVVLERGASVGGTITYDDGTPASGLGIELLVKDHDGKFKPMGQGRYRFFNASTDDNGHYRITGLPPGEYATQANLSVSDRETTYGPMPGNPGTTVEMQMMKVRFSLPLYSGDVMRKSEAKPYTLGSGEARAGSDLVFPLAKLHKVSGQVIAKDGHPVNGGTVSLLYPDDRDEMTETPVLFDDAAFHLEFVPEGDFLLKVSGAKDVSKVQVANPAGYMPRFHQEEKTAKSYGDLEQPLTVKGDTSDVLAMVPEGKAQ